MNNISNFTNPYIALETKKSSGRKKLSMIEFLFFAMMIFYYLLPSVNAGVPFVAVLAICVVYTGILCLLDTEKMEFYLILIGISALVSIMYFYLTETGSINANVSNYTLKRLLSKFQQVFMSFFPLLIFYRIATRATEKQKVYLLLLMGVVFLYVVINTTIELGVNPDATRYWEDFSEQSEKNVATYTYVYAVPIAIGILPYLIVNMKGKYALFYKTILVALGIFLFVFLLFAQYTLAVLIAIVVLLAQIAKYIKSSIKKVIFFGSLLIVVILAPFLLSIAASVVPSAQMAERLQEVAEFFSTGDTSGYNISGRLGLYGKTIKAFLKSPIVGNRKLPFDGHATFLTIFADIGILGGGAFVLLYALAKKQIKRLFTPSKYKVFLTLFFGLILMGLTNPIHAAAPLSVTIWLLVPLMIHVKKEKKDETSLGD